VTNNCNHNRPTSRSDTAELLRRHDRKGPRYTSYPTAIEFKNDLGHEQYLELLTRANAKPDEPLSMYMHLPFCESRCTFCGCNVIITPHHEVAIPYIELLEKEIGMLAEKLPDRRTFSQLHLGGGTPTFHPPKDLRRILGRVFEFFTPTENAELAVEVDPRVTTEEHIKVLAELGFNRISMGVQDLTPKVQDAIGRIQTLEQTKAIVDQARANGYTGINVDLIYGLPHQTEESFETMLESVLSLRPDRAAVYSFAWVPGIKGNQRYIDEAMLPSGDLKFELFAIAREQFLKAGYEPIGMDHFALPEDELSHALREGRLRRNFQGYATIPADDVVGLGISSIGDISGSYVQNEKKLSTYRQALDADQFPAFRGISRDDDDGIRRTLIHELMCNFRVDKRDIESTYGIKFDEYFATDLIELAELVESGLANIDAESISATATGELFVRNLAMCFDRYRRDGSRDGKQVFSRTV
jgi:oxygen-independent coproporphyrinogen-3 oxidase